jgi:hypothetical protein
MSGDFLSDEEFAVRYMITSVKGRVYTRSMLYELAMKRLRTSPLPLKADGRIPLGSLNVGERMRLTDAILNDDGFMRRLAGQIPARVVEAIEDRAWEIERPWR